MSKKDTAPQSEENPLETLTKGAAVVFDGAMLDLKKELALDDAANAVLVKARDYCTTCVGAVVEQAFVLGMHAGHGAATEAQKAAGYDDDLAKDLDNVTAMACVLDQIERLANDVVLDGIEEGKPSDLAVRLITWRTAGLQILADIAAHEATDPRGSDEDPEAGDDAEKAAGTDGLEKTAPEVFLGPLAKFNAILAAVDIAAEAAAEGCLEKALNPAPFHKLSLATGAFAEALNALPDEVAVEFTKGTATILEADLFGALNKDAPNPALLRELQAQAAAIQDVIRAELAKTAPKPEVKTEDIVAPTARAARLAALNKTA